MNFESRLAHAEKLVEEKRPQPMRVLAIPPGCVDPEWMDAATMISTGADFQWQTKGNDLKSVIKVLDYLAPGSVIE